MTEGTLHFPLSTSHSPLRVLKPEDIRLCDPACGSGHILAYTFDLLYLIYEEEGYAADDIPGLILKHNLFGIEICPRAAQLAELTLVLKAREKSRRFFSEAKAVRPNILELCDVRFDDDDLSEYLEAVDLNSYFENQAREWIETGDLLARNDHFDASETARDLLAVLVADELLAPSLDSLDLDPRFRAKLRKLLLSGKELDGLSSRENREIAGLSSAETRDLAQATFRTFVSSGEILKYASKLNLGDLPSPQKQIPSSKNNDMPRVHTEGPAAVKNRCDNPIDRPIKHRNPRPDGRGAPDLPLFWRA